MPDLDKNCQDADYVDVLKCLCLGLLSLERGPHADGVCSSGEVPNDSCGREGGNDSGGGRGIRVGDSN